MLAQLSGVTSRESCSRSGYARPTIPSKVISQNKAPRDYGECEDDLIENRSN